ncbi:MAG: hypothetical protein MMC23_003039 [Stictis urceolatum]|nr:hypothetical protein [Stictis urceolata]
MEQLEIHSKSYLVRWVDVKAEHTISWSIQPHKKSINFGIFKHPGSHIAPPPRADSSTFEAPPTPGLKAEGSDAFSRDAPSVAVEKLKSIGLKLVNWHGTCEANQVTTGTYNVAKTEGGMYALVFDNTFAKQFSKTATFVLLTYPTNAAPQQNHQIRGVQGGVAGSSQTKSIRHKKSRPKLGADAGQPRSSDSLPTHSLFHDGANSDFLAGSKDLGESTTSSNFYTGILQKRRRKRHQGYARRYFSLDFSSSTLSYYHNRNTVAMRGSVPLSVAAIGTNEESREISIDSGAEVWHLKAPSRKEFEAWKEALEVASMSNSRNTVGSGPGFESLRRSHTARQIDPKEEREWARVEDLASRVAKSRNLARSLAKDTDPKYLPSVPSLSSAMNQMPSSSDASPNDFAASDDYFETSEKRSFWKRKQSKGKPELPKRSASAQSNVPLASGRNGSVERQQGSTTRLQDLTDTNIHDQCMSMLRELGSVVAEFQTLIAESKHRRAPPQSMANSRMSLDSRASEEFFDAEAGDSLLFTIHQSDDEASHTEPDTSATAHDDSSASEIDEDEGVERSAILAKDAKSLYPSRSKPPILPEVASFTRRTTIPAPKQQPPSLIGFLRKNVGKDLSTISMPVTANEPISLLQKIAEQMEYSTLLDAASSPSLDSTARLLYITAFAISSLSSSRIKERAIRKPFNPMLGETYELLRPDQGYRFLAEKVSHRPVRMACQADSANWSLLHSPLPTQKFWGKSAEIIMEGRVRLSMHSTGEHYSWTPATCFLRNIIAGEKYVEPVNTMTVHNDTTGAHALVTFKAKGMFSGRSEEVQVQTFDADGEELPAGLQGRWAHSLTATDGLAPRSGPPLWSAGALVPDAPKRYGFTEFAAQLNELGPEDEKVLPPSDSRRRPDQRAAEEGDIDEAEELKARLEEAQRARRREMEDRGEEWVPAWFSRIQGGAEGEEVWGLKGGKEGYWESRARGEWKRGRRVFEL